VCCLYRGEEEWLHQESNFTGHGLNNAQPHSAKSTVLDLAMRWNLLVEKLLRFVETAEDNPLFAQELPSFVAEIKRIFSVAEVRNYAVRIECTNRLSVPQRAAIRAISSISARIH
jgi:hypothetical protein